MICMDSAGEEGYLTATESEINYGCIGEVKFSFCGVNFTPHFSSWLNIIIGQIPPSS